MNRSGWLAVAVRADVIFCERKEEKKNESYLELLRYWLALFPWLFICV